MSASFEETWIWNFAIEKVVALDAFWIQFCFWFHFLTRTKLLQNWNFFYWKTFENHSYKTFFTNSSKALQISSKCFAADSSFWCYLSILFIIFGVTLNVAVLYFKTMHLVSSAKKTIHICFAVEERHFIDLTGKSLNFSSSCIYAFTGRWLNYKMLDLCGRS